MIVQTDEQTRAFIIAAHGNLAAVQQTLAEHPDWLPVYYDWGDSGLENAIGAAAHVGNRTIAEYLLEQGAEPTICVWAMLGDVDEVTRILRADPSQANARGAHGIPVLFHAAMSGNMEVIEALAVAGCNEGFNFALHGAVNFGHADVVHWLLAHGVTDAATKDFQGKTPLEKAQQAGADEIVQLLQA
jgi:uncharacterized protein